MFTKIAKFFIENSKLTFVLVIATFIVGVASYIIIPKQYNPEIIVPAFNITIKANSLTPSEVKKYITSPLENKIMELEGIDEVYGISGEGYSGVMAKFKVGVDKEKAKIRLSQKLSENMELKPLGVESPIIKTIDPDELPQITFAISYKESNKNPKLDEEDIYIYLRQVANIIKDEIKTIKNITTIDIVGGYKKDIIINLDIQKIQAKNTNITQILNVLKNNNLNSIIGNLNLKSGEKILINVDGKSKNLKEIKNIIIGNNNNNKIYLKDIADIKYGVKRLNKASFITENNLKNNKPTYLSKKKTVFIGFGKKIGTNSIFITNNIKEKIEEIKKQFPSNIEIKIIQDEGKTAKDATNMLLINLLQSIAIVVFILTLSLGFKNALNTAISIPLTLFSVFSISLLIGENINRITLFALILVLGMLVDDSTVVVENISRHLKKRKKEGKTKLEAILNAIKEVELGVILSTITRLLAFGAMFAVGGMMGEYMGPIPKFAIMASVISTAVALTINPWISFHLTKDNSVQKKKIKKRKWSIRKIYIKFLTKFLGEEKKAKFKRKIFKLIFWISLFFIIVGPIYIGVFKARMLPKSNQNQVYLWIDAPRGWNSDKNKEIEKEITNFFLDKKNKELNIVKNISSTIGQSFMGDFANLFRGGGYRVGENQISLRINLYSPEEYKDITGLNRINSEKFVIEIRPLLRKNLLIKYPDIKLRLLEDPPGPPVRSTFRAKIKGNATKENLYYFTKKVEKLVKKIALQEDMVDIVNNFPTTYRKINLKINHESLSLAGLTTKQIINSLAIITSGLDITTIMDKDSLESTNIVLTSKNNNSLNLLDNFTLTNTNGKKIPLSSVVKKEITFVESEIETDNRKENYIIAAEMGNNSLIYPQIKLIKKIMSDDFLGKDFDIKSWSLYEINLVGLKDGKDYIIEWGGEWDLTLDTFRDLGTAMAISLLGIYLLLVGQFRSFGVARVIMITFLLGFFGVFGGFSLLYIIKNEYFSATSMIGIIALGGIVVGNAILLIEYINILKKNGLLLKDALLKAGYTRFKPIILTSLTTVFGAATIIGDPVWSGLAWAIIGGLLISSILTLIVIPIFYYDSQKNEWE